MDIVFGVSMTPTTVRMVMVEGERADGLTVDHDAFDITCTGDPATSSASDQVISAILGTQQSAVSGGHRLIATGVTCSDHDDAAVLREGLANRGIEDVMLVSELDAARALAQAAGRTVGYDKTALMLVDRDRATLSVIETGDGSIVNMINRSLQSTDATAVLTEMVSSLQAHNEWPDGMFVLGSSVAVTSVKEHLGHLVSIPVSAPEDPEMALARGAAMAAAIAPRFDTSTIGLAYSKEPEDGTTVGAAYRVDGVGVAGQLADVDEPGAYLDGADTAQGYDSAEPGRKRFLLTGSSLTAIFGIGVTALTVSLAVNIQTTVDQRPGPGENSVYPSTAAPAPPAMQNVQPAKPNPTPEAVPAPVPRALQPEPALVGPVAAAESLPPPAAKPRAAPPVGSPPAAPAPPPPVLVPAPFIQVPGIPPIPIFPPPRYNPSALTPRWYPVLPQTPQWPDRRGSHRGDWGD